MKPHILDVTPRKVRMPSKHCRVFSMLTSTQRPPPRQQLGFNPPLQSIRTPLPELVGTITAGTCPLVRVENPSFSQTAAKLAIQILNKRPSKRVSTSLCTLVAQPALNTVRFHCNDKRQTGTWSKEKPLHDDCCCMDLSTQLVDKLAPELAVYQLTLASSRQATASSTG